MAEARLPLAARMYQRLGPRWLPFADIATPDMPLSRLLRLSLFQLTCGMVQTLFFGTLNRVMIVELHVSASIVSIMIAIPLLVAPFRALIGFRSDTHRSVLGWKRVPFVWAGSMMQFAGLSIMPFALIILSGEQAWGPRAIAYVGSALAFFLVGAGAHTVQTAGLALANDIAPEGRRPRVIALMYLMLLVGTVVSALALGGLLRDFSPIKLVQVIQGAAVFTIAVNGIAMWQQEARSPGITPYKRGERRPMFREAWRTFSAGGDAVRLLTAVGLGFFAFNMQDVLLEPYGGEIFHFTVSQTTWLTGIMALGAITAFALAARLLEKGIDPIRLAALGAVVGILAFALVVCAGPLDSTLVFRAGTFLIGTGEGMFGVGTLSAAMGLRDKEQHGIALGAWGAVFATSEGIALASAGAIKDGVAHLIQQGRLSEGLSVPSVPYSVVYHIEILVLFATLVALGPLVSMVRAGAIRRQQEFGLADLPA
jgi:BCD family chlorophyll transporter-like MFS transporter